MEKMDTSGGEEVFALKLKELEEQKLRKIWMAERWKEYSLNNIEHVYEAQKKQVRSRAFVRGRGFCKS